ncbi:MAG: hypothetical protein ACRCYU_04190 [Nocardioides sp.]
MAPRRGTLMRRITLAFVALASTAALVIPLAGPAHAGTRADANCGASYCRVGTFQQGETTRFVVNMKFTEEYVVAVDYGGATTTGLTEIRVDGVLLPTVESKPFTGGANSLGFTGPIVLSKGRHVIKVRPLQISVSSGVLSTREYLVCPC